MDETKTTENGEPRIDADIKNLEITAGIQNWNENGITSGQIRIELPNGQTISIRCATSDDTGKVIGTCIDIHNMKETSEITIFREKGDKLLRRTRRIDGHVWTDINYEVA
tara:strand:+ start:353 stop:682 length:330 start_codon:yes stop_codon:yes gene_type:complete